MLRVPLDELREGEVVLPETAARYVTRVHRLREGARLLVFDPAARLEADAEVRRVEGGVTIHIGPPRAATNVARRVLTVIQSLAKGSKVDAVVRDATELGATKVVVARAERSVKHGGQARRWRRIALEAARQCGRGDMPDIEVCSFDDALRAHAPSEGLVALCLHPAAAQPLGEALQAISATTPLVVAIGPEGGFTEAELSLAIEQGYRLVALGPFVLRTETACAAALGAIVSCGK